MRLTFCQKIGIRMFGWAPSTKLWMPYGNIEKPLQFYAFKCKKHGIVENHLSGNGLYCPMRHDR